MRTTHDRHQIERLLVRKDREGLTYTELSQESGIPASTLAGWRRRLRLEGEANLFEEVAAADLEECDQLEVVGPCGHRIAIPAEFDDELLRRVIAALPC
jgi:transposase-like protein